eukprot:TRINITY_DN6378_c0_g2_i1.p1 TRINITY_DN6378_c0_g2~~TRINITY_DN6378_c0_g2_i1.p1  ORF type:complete len:612 (+),score=219.02 TRINITY_DN6378_c0_g2_i1:589-2424(+)
MIRSTEHKSIWKFCISLLKAVCNNKPAIINKILESILAVIEKERLNGATAESRRVLKSGIEMLMESSFYKKPFEDMLIDSTRAFYAKESTAQIAKGSIKNYIAYMQAKFGDEHERLAGYLDLSTGPRVQTVLEEVLIKKHIEVLIGSGFVSLAEEQAIAELKALYESLKSIGAIDDLKKSWTDYLHKKGLVLFQAEKTSEEIVEDLIAFKQSMDTVLASSFESEKNFKLSLKNSFEDVLNSNANRSAEYVAKYLDMYLNTDALKIVKKRSDEEIKGVVDHCMPLFKLILNKDIFEAFYLRRLSKRLLFNKTVSSECEKYLLDKLREECGPNYTRKAEAMFQDMEVTQEFARGFERFMEDNMTDKLDFQFSAAVLTFGAWPFEAFIPIPLPREISVMQEQFTKYYEKENQKKRLHWNTPFSSATIVGRFDKEYLIETSGLQAIILLLFNNSRTIVNADVSKLLGLAVEANIEKRRQVLEVIEAGVYSLVKSKLICSEENKLEKESKLSLNEKFSSKLKRIVITRMNKKEKAEESKETEERVMEERKYEIDAAIMKIMKGKKTASHSELLEKLRPQLKFLFQPPTIKKRIEGLIEREYLKRDEKDPNIYIYIS